MAVAVLTDSTYLSFAGFGHYVNRDSSLSVILPFLFPSFIVLLMSFGLISRIHSYRVGRVISGEPSIVWFYR